MAEALAHCRNPDLSPAQVRQLLADTASNTPTGGRSDALGTGVVDAAAALEVGASVEATAQRPVAEPYPKEHFGRGPEPTKASTAWLAPSAAALGALFVAGAVFLYRGTGGLRRY